MAGRESEATRNDESPTGEVHSAVVRATQKLGGLPEVRGHPTGWTLCKVRLQAYQTEHTRGLLARRSRRIRASKRINTRPSGCHMPTMLWTPTAEAKQEEIYGLVRTTCKLRLLRMESRMRRKVHVRFGEELGRPTASL